MKIIGVDLINFGPFRGEQHIALDVAENAPIVLVHGENMRGKTTLLRAIRWALYGEVTAHDGTVIDPADFANYEERDLEEDFEFGARLTFEDRGSMNELNRICSAYVERTQISATVRIRSTTLSLRPVDGNPIPERDIPEFIARTLHKDIADYFLFDGEMLARFEERLRSDATRAGQVKRSIERVLGLPALQLIKQDVSALLQETDAVLRRAARRKLEAAKIEAEYASTEDEVSRVNNDLDELRRHQQEVSVEVARLGDELAAVESVKEMFYRRKALEEELDEIDSDLNDLGEQYRAKLVECWWVPLAAKVQARLDRMEDDIANAIELNTARQRLGFQLDQLRSQSNEKTCALCGQALPSHVHDDLSHKIEDLGRRLEGMPHVADLSTLQTERRRLAIHAATNVSDRLHDLDQDIARLTIRRLDRAGQISELSENLRDTRLDIAAVESNYQGQRDLLREIEDAINNAEQQKSKKEQHLRLLSQELAKHAGASTPEKRERDLLDAIEMSVDGALDQFRYAMRLEVERQASNIFKKLSTEHTYAGLRIDGRYHLEIIDEHDNVIKRRSAGADQIVTMSLIGALVRCAVRQGPVVMDTPFGRLDRGHRERILRWVPTLGTQVVLFVQSGEFDRERDLAFLNGMVGREYRLRRVTATNTTIEALRDE